MQYRAVLQNLFLDLFLEIDMGIFSFLSIQSHAEDHHDEVVKAHNDGQRDAGRGEYKLPYNAIARDIPFASTATTSEMKEVNASYEAGHAHTESQKSGCYLTTACVHHAGLADDCHELVVLRSFRDGYMSALPGGPLLVARYYKIAPAILERIQLDSERETILSRIFAMVTDAVRRVENGDDVGALAIYEAQFLELTNRYQLQG
ncbi:hypothetical protein KGM48_03715 [Patescibacteria group bacterium]|nr:hypothetical protein [Patescibacteria group bacterium]